jgi:hypothetical protein
VLIREYDIPVIGDVVEKLLLDVHLSHNFTKINWDKPATLDALSPISGIGAVNFCFREQLREQVRVWIHKEGRSQHLWLRSKRARNAKRVRLYPNGARIGEDASHCWFNATGFLHEGSAAIYLFMGLHSDYPFMWAVSRKELERQWYRIDQFGKNHKYAEDDVFRIPHKQWDNEGGFMRLRLPVRSQFALTRINQVGF